MTICKNMIFLKDQPYNHTAWGHKALYVNTEDWK